MTIAVRETVRVTKRKKAKTKKEMETRTTKKEMITLDPEVDEIESTSCYASGRASWPSLFLSAG